MPAKVHLDIGQSNTVVVENLFIRSGSHSSMDNSTQEVPLPRETTTATQHRNADGLSKRTNDYRWREQLLEKLPPVTER